MVLTVIRFLTDTNTTSRINIGNRRKEDQSLGFIWAQGWCTHDSHLPFLFALSIFDVLFEKITGYQESFKDRMATS
jgi:hypothetical protein